MIDRYDLDFLLQSPLHEILDQRRIDTVQLGICQRLKSSEGVEIVVIPLVSFLCYIRFQMSEHFLAELLKGRSSCAVQDVEFVTHKARAKCGFKFDRFRLLPSPQRFLIEPSFKFQASVPDVSALD